MKSVLISIQPKWCELIANRKKTVEVRKTRPKIDVPFKCYIYCTKDKHGWFDFLNKTSRDGKVIGEFVCDWIQEYRCEFVDDDCYESIVSVGYDDDGDLTGTVEWSNDSGIPYIGTEFFEKCCVSYTELKKYMGVGFATFYGWHISDLVIYDKPKDLCEFLHYCGDNPDCEGCEAFYYSNTESGKEEYCCSIIDGYKPLKRPPQSWCYVETDGGSDA